MQYFLSLISRFVTHFWLSIGPYIGSIYGGQFLQPFSQNVACRETGLKRGKMAAVGTVHQVYILIKKIYYFIVYNGHIYME
jgi:hypothetical protein